MLVPSREKLYYLASPFSHPNIFVRFKRFYQITKIGARLIKQGYKIIPPITSSYLFGILGNIKGDFDTWKDLDLKYIERCDGVIVATMDGWNKSKGVIAEVNYAFLLSLPVYKLNPKTMEIKLC